jgi:hypothetical protein
VNKKGGPPLIPFKTRKPSLPISRLAAFLARRRFHPRTPIWSFVGLLASASWNQVHNRPRLCQVLYVTSEPHPTCKRLCEEPLFLPAMILRLRCGVVNPKMADETVHRGVS